MSNIRGLPKSYSDKHYGYRYASASNYTRDSYYSDQYSEDDYTDEDDSGSEYDDERSEYDHTWGLGLEYYYHYYYTYERGDLGSEYSSEEEYYHAIYLNDDTQSWSSIYKHTTILYMYTTPSHRHESKPVTTPRNSAAKFLKRSNPITNLSMPKNDLCTPKNIHSASNGRRNPETSSPTRDFDRRQGYNLDSSKKESCSNYRAAHNRASSETREKSTNPKQFRAATGKPRLLFAPSPGAKSPVAKGREFEDYFKKGVERARSRGNISAKVEFQKKLNVTPG